MPNKHTIGLVSGITIVAGYALFLVLHLNSSYPAIGHDYSYFIPRLLDTYLHYRVNGPSIQWYTPRFGGGLPAYANPQHLQFSLPQLLVFLADPWTAIRISACLCTAVGFAGGYLLFRRVLGCQWTSSLVGALLLLANGFFIHHLTVGHLTWLAYPFWPVLLALGLRRTSSVLPESIALSLLLALCVYGGAFYLLVIFAFSLLVFVPLLHLCSPSPIAWRTVGWRTLWALGLALCLTASKLYAVFSLMRQFPRDLTMTMETTWPRGLAGILVQLLGTVTLAPSGWSGSSRATAVFGELQRLLGIYSLGVWECDIALPPTLWGLLILGAGVACRTMIRRRSYRPAHPLALIALACGVGCVLSVILTKGIVYSAIKSLPVMHSLGMPPRFTAAFIIPLVLVATLSYERIATHLHDLRAAVLFVGVISLTLLSLRSFSALPADLYFLGFFNVAPAYRIYASIRGGTVPGVHIIAHVPDWQTFELEASNIAPYEALFGYALETFETELQLGPVDARTGDYLNMNNASGLVYPAVNGTRPFERIRARDAAMLAEFVAYKQPHWKMPAAQKILNGLSLGTLAAQGFAIAYWRRCRRKQRSVELHPSCRIG